MMVSTHNRIYGSAYYPNYERDGIEYPGYDNSWVLGRERDSSFYHDDYHRTPSYASYRYYPGSRSSYYPEAHYDHGAHLAWATEIPVRLRMTICCEGCKMKLDRTLRDMHGVHDITISGWTHAMVTVTGTAPARKILKKARKVSKTAEFWSDSSYVDDYGSRYSHSHSRYR